MAIVAIAGAGATHESRWYVTPFFSTWVVITMLLYSNPTIAEEQWRFNERVGETVLGVGLAYVFGLLVPDLLARLHGPSLKLPGGPDAQRPAVGHGHILGSAFVILLTRPPGSP